jgi:hypothetical protein
LTYLPRGQLNIGENNAKMSNGIPVPGRGTAIFPVGPQRKYLRIIEGGG